MDYAYDLVGKIQQVNAPTGTYAFAYDNMGRLIGTTTSYSFLTSRSFSNAYTYDAALNRTVSNLPCCHAALFALWESVRNDPDHHSDERPTTERLQIGSDGRLHFGIVIGMLRNPHL